MRGYADRKQSNAEHGNGERAAAAPYADASAVRGALGEPRNQSPRPQSLLQMRRALDESSGVRMQLALQRALNRRAAPQQSQMPEASPQKEFAPRQRKPKATGLPDPLKAGVEHLSGFAMDDVKVHFNSAKPAAVQALAYTQGTDIHVGPGQEQHLPHEAWHVVQQKQGRVKPTLQMKGVAINDDAGLEREADGMGRVAAESERRTGKAPEAPIYHSSEATIQMKNGDKEKKKKNPLGFGSSAPRFMPIVPSRRFPELHAHILGSQASDQEEVKEQRTESKLEQQPPPWNRLISDFLDLKSRTNLRATSTTMATNIPSEGYTGRQLVDALSPELQAAFFSTKDNKDDEDKHNKDNNK